MYNFFLLFISGPASQYIDIVLAVLQCFLFSTPSHEDVFNFSHLCISGPPFPIGGSCSSCSDMFLRVDLGNKEDDVKLESWQGKDDLENCQ